MLLQWDYFNADIQQRNKYLLLIETIGQRLGKVWNSCKG